MLTFEEFFDLTEFRHSDLFSPEENVWTALDHLPDYLSSFFQAPWPLSHIFGQVERPLVIHNGSLIDGADVNHSGPKSTIQVRVNGEVLEGAAVILPGAYLFNDKVIIGPGTVVEPGACIKGPVVIGKNSEVRQGAYVRGNCLVGDHCVVGHTTEIKGSIMLDNAKAGHFAYIGDSILGNNVNLGAGTKLANLKMIPGTIVIRSIKERHDTGRRKLGAILGDQTETGCNSVTSPGTLMGPHSIVYPGIAVPGGYYPKKTLFMPSPGLLRIKTG